MGTLRLTIDLKKITSNAEKALALCRSHGMDVMGVTKGVCGDAEVARAILGGGVKVLGDARLDNIIRMREAGIVAPLTLIRSPAPSEVAECVAYADSSLNGDLGVLKALSAEATRTGKTHKVILMADLNTGREGFAPDELPGVVREVLSSDGLALEGVGLYLDYRSDDEFVMETQRHFVALANDIERGCGVRLPVISGGSTNVFRRVLKGKVVPGINQLRIGTSILLGIASSLGPIVIEEFDRDTFILEAALIEVKQRDRLIGVLSLGKLDAPHEQLFPRSRCVQIIDATNDHTVVDLGDLPTRPRPGDTISFHLGYSALNRLMASCYVHIQYQ